jgi:hypothetical protein
MTGPTQEQRILAPPAKSAIFLVATVHSGAETEVRDLLTEVGDWSAPSVSGSRMRI